MSRDTDARLVANRFGLGARPAEIASLRDDPRGALRAQLAGPAPLIGQGLPGSQDLLARTIALREARSEGKGQPDAVKLAKALREIHGPAYQDDVHARLEAAVTGSRSVVERLVQFWSNHFAVSVDKLAVLGLAGPMEREAIRPNVLGRFPDMLRAVTQHPAMLLYLDNHLSIGPDSRIARLTARRARARALGLNENLGRELLELHTLGVDGGYTQQDVTTLAAVITGWSIGGRVGRFDAGDPGKFLFREAFHEPGAKTVLGRRYADDGLHQGERVLQDLARHPKTARHLATKLARHFIADEPPAAAIDAITKAWLDSEGHLPTVYEALFARPEAWLPGPAKYKTPADFIHSAWRALELPLPAAKGSAAPFVLLGQRPWQPGSPAGWPDRAADWDGSAALIQRIEWSSALAHRRGVRVDAVARADAVLGDALGDMTRTGLARAQDGVQALTLLLASPEFMRR